MCEVDQPDLPSYLSAVARSEVMMRPKDAPMPHSDIALLQSQGCRDYQEDVALWRSLQNPFGEGSRTLLLLADGMGGHAGGAVASRLAIDAALDALTATSDPAARLHAGLVAANDAIAAAVSEQPDLDGMGCTLILAIAEAEGLSWLSVGDSPLWLWREGALQRLNEDHSMAPFYAKLVQRGRMTVEEARTSPKRTSLRAAVVGRDIKLVDHPAEPVPLCRGDWVMVASDGVETLDEQTLAGLITKAKTPEDAATLILQEIKAAGRPDQDNTTVLLFRYDCATI
jgi:protein phosphatase